MRLIGLIGGMSWESTGEYYRILNETVHARLGGLHSARCLLYSVDFAEIERMQVEGRWEDAAAVMVDAAERLQRAGAGLLVICANTMHKLVPQIQAAVDLPILHIADAAAWRVQEQGMTRVGLLGTRYTMEEDFIIGRLERNFGLEIFVPSADDRQIVNRVIFEELVLGDIRPESRAAYSRVMHGLAERGAQGIILGCTEISLLVDEKDSPVPLFDTTLIHAEAAVDWALLADE